MNSENLLPLELRLLKRHLTLGVASAIGFAAMGIESVVVAALNADGSFPRPILMATAFGLFWARCLFSVCTLSPHITGTG